MDNLRKRVKHLSVVLVVAALLAVGMFLPSASADDSRTLVLGDNMVSVPANSQVDYTFVVPEDGAYSFLRNGGDEDINMKCGGGLADSSPEHHATNLKAGQNLTISIINTSQEDKTFEIDVASVRVLLAPTNVRVNGILLTRNEVINVEPYELIHLTFDPVGGAEFYQLNVNAGDGSVECFDFGSNNDVWFAFGYYDSEKISCDLHAGSFEQGSISYIFPFNVFIDKKDKQDDQRPRPIYTGTNTVTIPEEGILNFEYTVPSDGTYFFEFYDFTEGNPVVEYTLSGDGISTQTSNDCVWGVYRKGQMLNLSIKNISEEKRTLGIDISNYLGVLSTPTNVIINGDKIQCGDTLVLSPLDWLHIYLDEVENAEQYFLGCLDANDFALFYNISETNDFRVQIPDVAHKERIYCGISANADGWRWSDEFFFYILISDPAESIPEMILPKSLERIDSEAFAGIAAKKVILPDGITSIANNAFTGSNVEILAGGNAYVRQYASDHGMQYIVNH